MLTRHRGLMIFLLFAVVGHASLIERWFGRAAPLWQVGFALILAPIVLVLLGEWIAEDATTTKWQRGGWGLAVVGAAWHLVLDVACLTLPRSGTQWWFSVAGAAAGAIVMTLALRRAWRGFVDPEAPDANPAQASPDEGLLGRCGRELALFGGTPVALLLVSLGFVAMAVIGLLKHPWNQGSLFGGLFFACCGAIAVWMGLDRRAMLLGQPSPFARLRPRFLRRVVVLATQEGLAQLDKNGATVYAWEIISEVWLGEMYGNAALLVSLVADAPAIRVPRAGRPRSDTLRWAKREVWNRRVQRALTDSDLAIMGMFTEEGPGVLAQQIKAALTAQAERAKLPTLVAAMTGAATRR